MVREGVGTARGTTATTMIQSPWMNGVRWILAATEKNVVAWKIIEKDGALTMEIGWTSRDIAAPLTPMIINGVVFAISSGDRAVLYALDAATGKEKWKFATPRERRFAAAHLHGASPVAEIMPDPFDFYLSSPVVSNGNVYFGSGLASIDSNAFALCSALATITIPAGQHVRPLPDGDRYLGFVFAEGETQDQVERTLGAARERLRVVIE